MRLPEYGRVLTEEELASLMPNPELFLEALQQHPPSEDDYTPPILVVWWMPHLSNIGAGELADKKTAIETAMVANVPGTNIPRSVMLDSTSEGCAFAFATFDLLHSTHRDMMNPAKPNHCSWAFYKGPDAAGRDGVPEEGKTIHTYLVTPVREDSEEEDTPINPLMHYVCEGYQFFDISG